MSRIGLPITGKGADLSLALLGYVRHRVALDGDARDVGSVSLTMVPDTDDWGIRPSEMGADRRVLHHHWFKKIDSQRYSSFLPFEPK